MESQLERVENEYMSGWVKSPFGVKIVFGVKMLKIVKRKNRRCLEIWMLDVKTLEMVKLLVMSRPSVQP